MPPTTIGTSNTERAVWYPFQRKVFYANGRWWAFYCDETNLVYRTSTNGTTWSDATILRTGTDGNEVSVWFDGTYLHYAYSLGTSTYGLYYRRGLPNNDGLVTWSADEQTVIAGESGKSYSDPFVAADSSGYPWIAYAYSSAGSTYPYVIKNSKNDGTWNTDAGFPYALSATADTHWRASILPSTANKMVALYAYYTTVNIQAWTGSEWLSEVATVSSIWEGYFHSAIAEGNYVHLVFLKNDGETIVYTKYSYATNSFSAETNVQSGLVASFAPVLSAAGDLYCFWGGLHTTEPNHVFYKKYSASTGTWDSSPTDWITESEVITLDDRLTGSYQASNNKIGLLYTTETGFPYHVRFEYLTVEPFVALLNPGYWHATYWTRGYWNPLYWPRYGAGLIGGDSRYYYYRKKSKSDEELFPLLKELLTVIT